MDKSPDAFRTISEVADWLGVQAHVLRFWESKFTQVKPVKRAGGRRYYRPADMMLLGGIKKLLHEDGMTIKGVQKILREQGIPHVSEMSQSLDDMAVDGSKPRRAQTVSQSQNRPPPPPSRPKADTQIELALDPEGTSPAPVETDDVIEPPIVEAQRPEPEPMGEPEDIAESVPTPTFSARQRTEAPAPEPAPQESASNDDGSEESEDAAPPMPTFRRHTAPRPPEPDEIPVKAEGEPPAIEEPEIEAPAPEPEPVAEIETPVEPVEEVAGPRPRIVDAPDPPEDDEINAVPGLLSLLAKLDHLSADQVEDISALADALDDWRSAQPPQHAGV